MESQGPDIGYAMSSTSHRVGKLVDGVLGWLNHNLDLFNPVTNGTELDPLRCKAIAEISCMCMLYHHRIRGYNDPRQQKFVSFIHEVWQIPEYQERVVRYPHRIRQYAMTYIALLRCGIVDRSYHEILQRVVDQGYVTAVEEVPFRGLDLRHILDCSGFRHNLPSYEDLYQKTLLAKTPSLLYLTDSDVYSITHTIYYISDFGFRRIDAISERQLATVHWMIGTLLGIYLRLKDWDLVGELLLCCYCLRWSPPFVFDVAWKALLDAQLPDGSVPGPTFSEAKLQQLSDLEQRKYYFEQNYHTTLVGALAGFMNDYWLLPSANLTPRSQDTCARCKAI